MNINITLDSVKKEKINELNRFFMSITNRIFVSHNGKRFTLNKFIKSYLIKEMESGKNSIAFCADNEPLTSYDSTMIKNIINAYDKISVVYTNLYNSIINEINNCKDIKEIQNINFRIRFNNINNTDPCYLIALRNSKCYEMHQEFIRFITVIHICVNGHFYYITHNDIAAIMSATDDERESMSKELYNAQNLKDIVIEYDRTQKMYMTIFERIISKIKNGDINFVSNVNFYNEFVDELRKELQ